MTWLAHAATMVSNFMPWPPERNRAKTGLSLQNKRGPIVLSEQMSPPGWLHSEHQCKINDVIRSTSSVVLPMRRIYNELSTNDCSMRT